MNVCELCGEDHETRDCDLEVCAICGELLDNCDCTDHDATDWRHVLSAEEWSNR